MTRIFRQAVVSDIGIGINGFIDSDVNYPVITYLERWYHPTALAANDLVFAHALPASGTHTIETADLTNGTPDFPRSVSAVASAGATSKVTVYGTDYDGEAISEELTLNGTNTVNGAKAFATVTSILLAQRSEAANVSLGYGNKLGLKRQIVNLKAVSSVDGVFVSSRPTINTTNNTVLFSTALDPAKVYVLKYDSSDFGG